MKNWTLDRVQKSDKFLKNINKLGIVFFGEI